MIKTLRDLIFKRRLAYRATFDVTRPANEYVLADLQKFCRAKGTPAVVSPVSGMVDPIATGVAIGRFEVWQRITQHLNLPDDVLFKLVELQVEQGTE